MDKLVIKGGRQLSGTVAVSGSKNAALALMAAALLPASGKTVISRVPDLRDVHTLSNLLRIIGARVEFEKNSLTISAENISHPEAPYELVKQMRASVYVLGPLLGRIGRARVSLPGGCAWGPRPVDLHIKAMQALGASVEIEDGYIVAKAKRKRLVGAKIEFPISSVGATGNALMAAVLAKGTTKIKNAALEPEITALADMLMKMGAKISGIGTTELEIEGVEELYAARETNISDRIEAGTLLCAAAITKGEVTLTDVSPAHFKAVLKKFEQAGCEIKYAENVVSLKSPRKLEATNVEAKPFPKFPTDMQAQWTALMTQAVGTSKITDHIYADRFKHVPELNRLGANIVVKGNSAIVKGEQKLSGAKVMSTDLRASASLILAGLVASGTTEVLRVYHLDRGYEKIEQKLRALGANIRREQYDEFAQPKPEKEEVLQ
ncbi:MAG: UDP-N-acetylglucosamine 1-carboxyvinyltransferase [Chloroherpetonaceae bacterium]|nr:UDP-N-acetylglucosamine 1-carboxyvinyltransferase [Chloroherpetonaceae bacterium]MDW8436797.1 UDP-N-acetylglucosamine 1-carboxyvinyltransferase [Chloroherpetonaceae bacterium]